jgi:hypothetical protein
MGLLMVLIRGRTAVFDVLAIGVGCLFGALCLSAFFLENGVWHEFLKSVSILSGARRSVAARAAAALVAPFTEPSSTLLLAVLGLILVSALRRGDLRLRSPLGVGLLVGVLVPCFLALVGKYARYYSWMAFIPMAACVAAGFQSGRVIPVRRVVVPLLLLACAVGLPARLAITCREWKLRDPGPVDQVVLEQVRPTDWVYSEYEAYYPAKRAAAVLFLPPYAGLTPGMEGVQPPISAADRESVDLLILKPSTEQQTLRFFGRQWSMVGRYDAAGSTRGDIAAALGRRSQPYQIKVFRRQRGAIASASAR